MRDATSLRPKLDNRSLALLRRVEKEHARALPTTAAQSTALVGGWAKMGSELESFLAAALEWVCAREGREVDEEIRLAFPRGTPGKITAGQLLGVVRGLSHLQAAKANEVGAIYRDLANRNTSRINQLVELRNQVVHEPDALPKPERQKAALEPVAQLMRTYRRQAGFGETK